MNNWQPIETAPKDRRVLLAYKSGIRTVGILRGLIWESDFHRYHSVPIAWQELPVFDGVINES